MSQITLIHGTDYLAMTKRLLEADDVAARIGDRAKRIGVKPNLCVAKPAATGSTTHPEIVAGVLDYLCESGFTNVVVLEGSWLGDRTDRAARISGIGQVCADHGVPFLDLQQDNGQTQSLGGMSIEVCRKAMELDYLINLPVVKGHCQTTITCALKNLKGLIPNREKQRFHTLGLHKPIAHLSLAFPNTYVLADNICGDLDFEEGGNPVTMNRLIGCFDPVLCDAFVCETLGHAVEAVPYIGLAHNLGVGSADLDGAHIIPLNKANQSPAAAPTGRVAQLARHTDARNACSACYGSLIYALDRLGDQGLLRGSNGKIAIGQGWRSCCGSLGVGNCTAGCSAYLPGCPPTAAEMTAFLAEHWGK